MIIILRVKWNSCEVCAVWMDRVPSWPFEPRCTGNGYIIDGLQEIRSDRDQPTQLAPGLWDMLQVRARAAWSSKKMKAKPLRDLVKDGDGR